MAKTKIYMRLQDSELAEKLADGLPVVLDQIAVEFHNNPETANFCIVDENIFREKMMLAHLSEKSIVISYADERENIDLISQTQLNHIIGHNSGDLLLEISESILHQQKNSFWGIDRYLPKKAEIFSKGINDSREINDAIDEMINLFDFSSFFNTPKDSIRLITNELLTNALYNASHSRSKLFVQKPVDRKATVTVKASDHILFKMGVCRERIALSIADSFGTLTRHDIMNNLLRSVTEKRAKMTESSADGGAGLGFYLVFNYSNQFIVNLKQGVRTEVICLIDGNRRYKKYKERITSFHLFEEV